MRPVSTEHVVYQLISSEILNLSVEATSRVLGDVLTDEDGGNDVPLIATSTLVMGPEDDELLTDGDS